VVIPEVLTDSAGYQVQVLPLQAAGAVVGLSMLPASSTAVCASTDGCIRSIDCG